MPNALPILLAGGAALLLMGGKKSGKPPGGAAQARVIWISNSAQLEAWKENILERSKSETVRFIMVARHVPDVQQTHLADAIRGAVRTYSNLEIVITSLSGKEISSFCEKNSTGYADFWLDAQVRKPGHEAIQFKKTCWYEGEWGVYYPNDKAKEFSDYFYALARQVASV